MRTSKKSLLIQAALEIIDKKSLDALTYDSLAKASGMSKSGLLYHFPSRAALLLALNEHLASSWRASLLEAAGAPPEELPPANACVPSSRYSRKAQPAQTSCLLWIRTPAKKAPRCGTTFWAPGCSRVRKSLRIQTFTCCTSSPMVCGSTTTSIPTI